ncbi:MAG TPA: hypothetical protein VJO52_07930 [Gemmatimonadaceae bacterium]|nr:hypothetical protein [Gemmatimonadaceae bacterium]
MSTMALNLWMLDTGLARRRTVVAMCPVGHSRDVEREGWLSRHGIESADVFADGRGVIELRRFIGTPAARASAIAAMARLSGAERIVLDLRRHRGGDESMAALLTSLLFDTEPLYEDEVYASGESMFTTRPEARCARQAVEVWISEATSALGLAFTANLGRLGRATVRRVNSARL